MEPSDEGEELVRATGGINDNATGGFDEDIMAEYHSDIL